MSVSVGALEFMFGCVYTDAAVFSAFSPDALRCVLDETGESEKLEMSRRFNGGRRLERSSDCEDCRPSMWSGSAEGIRARGPGWW